MSSLLDLNRQEWDLLEKRVTSQDFGYGFSLIGFQEVRDFVFRENQKRGFWGGHDRQIRLTLDEAFQIPFATIPIRLGTDGPIRDKILRFRLEVGK